MRILILTLKDLEQIGNDRKSLLFLIVMPIVFTFFMGIAYGGAGSPTTADTRLRLAWVADSPEAPLAQRLFERLAGSATVNPIRMTATEAQTALGKDEVAGVLNVPTGFGAEPSVDQPSLALVADPAAASGQAVASSQA